MSELHFEKEKKGGKKRLVIIIILLIIIAAVVTALILNTDDNSGSITVSDAKTKAIDLALEPGTVYSHAVTNSKTFFFSPDNVKIASNTGNLEQDMLLKASDPIISTDGKYALIADKGGKTAHLFNGSKLEKSLTLEENIIISKVNSNGYSIFITEGDVHRHSAIVVNSSGEEIFKWKSGSMYVVSADISDNNKDIAISTVNTDNGVMTSNVYMFNVTKDKPFTNEPIPDEVLSAMQFDGSFMYCIGVAKTYIYNDYGKCIANIDYEDREILNYVISGGTVALLFSDSSKTAGGSLVRSYGAKGDFRGEFYVDSRARFMDLKDNSIAVDNNRVISILDSKCNEKFQLNTETALSDFLFLGSSSIAVGITATGAEIIEVKR